MEWLTNFSSSVLAFIVSLGVIIFVHEAGHLLMAKAFKVRVLTFSLGFGKRLWGFERNGTDYRVSLVPLGGYVKMSGEMPGESGDDPGDFLNKPRWQRVLIYLAGPVMNAILAVVLIAIVYMIGIEGTAMPNIPPIVGRVEEGSSAAAAGIRPGDRILEVDGQAVDLWERAQILLTTSSDRPVELRVQREDETFEVEVRPEPIPELNLHDTAGILPQLLLSITQVVSGQPADEAGLEAGDQLRAVDHQPIIDPAKFTHYIEAHAGREMRIDILRDGSPMSLTVVPNDVGGKGKIGVGLGIYQRYGPVQALVESVKFNIQILSSTVFVLKQIFTARIAAESALSGPLEIARISGQAARVGLEYLLYTMGIISISIGFLNLLPIPILDGGQICILAVESAMRRDLSLRFKEIVNQVGFVLILLLMVTVIGFDIKKSPLWQWLFG